MATALYDGFTSYCAERNYEQPGGENYLCHEISEISDSNDFILGEKKYTCKKNKKKTSAKMAAEAPSLAVTYK